MHYLIRCDRRRNLRDIVRQIGISFRAVQCILTNISGMFKVSARWVPRMLTKDQNKNRLDISKYLLSLYEMTLRNLSVKLSPKMRHGSITLILRPKSRVCNGSTLANTLLRNIREFLQQGRCWPLSFGTGYYHSGLP